MNFPEFHFPSHYPRSFLSQTLLQSESSDGASFTTELNYPYRALWAFLVAQKVKYQPAVWETWVRSLGQEEPLEKEMTISSSILAWRIPCTDEPGGLQSMGMAESQTRLEGLTLSPLWKGRTHYRFFLFVFC